MASLAGILTTEESTGMSEVENIDIPVIGSERRGRRRRLMSV